MKRAARTPAGPSRDAVSAVAMREVTIPPLDLAGTVRLPADATCLVVFAHGSGSSRFSPRNNAVAEGFATRGIATLLFDLLTPTEEGDRANVFDIPLLAESSAATNGRQTEIERKGRSISTLRVFRLAAKSPSQSFHSASTTADDR